MIALAKTRLYSRFSFSLLFLALFGPVSSMAQQADSVIYINGKDGGFTVPHSPSLSPTEGITISTWFRPETTKVSNSSEYILSKREFGSLADFENTANWEIHDATNAGLENNIRGFVGAVFDGRYVYVSPWWKRSDGQSESGHILRYDSQKPYNEASSWTVYDAEKEDGNIDIRGLEGAVFDGRYVYFAPLHYEGTYFSKVLRYDTNGDFSDQASWTVFNAGPLDPDLKMKGFVGAVFDGEYVYFVPNGFIPHGKVLRLNTKADFLTASSWDYFELANFDRDLFPQNGFFGGVFDGKYVYFVPFNSKGIVLRLNTTISFTDVTAWSAASLPLIFQDGLNKNYAGATFDGRYVYFSPIFDGNVIRFDTFNEFESPASWTTMIIKNLDGEGGVYGGVGPSFDGRFVYFPPMYGKVGRSGKVFVYDTFNEFTDIASWAFKDLALLDPQLRGFEGCVFDGQYVYFVPMNFDSPHGKIVRYNTAPGNKLSYQLSYNNNSSSSFGSVVKRPRFIVGTSKGMRAVTLHESSKLTQGQWHNLTATYDQTVLRLYLDGVLNNEIVYAEPAEILLNNAPLSVGRLEGDLTRSFKGQLNELNIWNKTMEEAEIQTMLLQEPNLNSQNLMAFYSFDKGRTSATIDDLSTNGNHAIEATSSQTFSPVVYAGPAEVVCPSGMAYILDEMDPPNGTWSGPSISTNGIFFPTDATVGKDLELTYSVKVKVGPYVKTFTAEKQISVFATPQIETSSLILCSDEIKTLAVSNDENFVAYRWDDDSQANAIEISTGGTYEVTVTIDETCELSSSITILEQPALAKPEISRTDLITLKASDESKDTEWFFNGNSLGVTEGSTLKLLAGGGDYEVKFIDENGCASVLSDPLFVEDEGVTLFYSKAISIFPNPTAGTINVGVSAIQGDGAVISVRNALGKTINSGTLKFTDTDAVFPVDLSDQPNGVYFVTVNTQTGNQTEKVIVQH